MAAKGALRHHRQLTPFSGSILADFELPERPSYLAVAPISHVAGTKVVPTLMRGGTVHMLKGFDPGLQTNMLRPSIVAAGLDPDDLPERGGIDIAKDIDVGAREERPERWRDIWSAGHSVSAVSKVLSVGELIEQTLAEYRAVSD
jgi:hypothetical protein